MAQALTPRHESGYESSHPTLSRRATSRIFLNVEFFPFIQQSVTFAVFKLCCIVKHFHQRSADMLLLRNALPHVQNIRGLLSS